MIPRRNDARLGNRTKACFLKHAFVLFEPLHCYRHDDSADFVISSWLFSPSSGRFSSQPISWQPVSLAPPCGLGA